MTSCNSCGRWITDTNPQAGRSCYLCLADWLGDEPDHLEPRQVPQAHVERECQACGVPTLGRDLCVRCDDYTTDPHAAVAR